MDRVFQGCLTRMWSEYQYANMLLNLCHLGSFQVAKEFGFQNNGFSVYINRNKTGEITASSNKSLNLLKIK